MKMGKITLALAAASLVSAPAFAAPVNPAASLSVAKSVRATSATGKKDRLAGGGIFVAIIAVVVVVAGIIVVAKNDDNSSSN